MGTESAKLSGRRQCEGMVERPENLGTWRSVMITSGYMKSKSSLELYIFILLPEIVYWLPFGD